MTTTIVPIIENTPVGLIVTSESVAQGAGIQHKNVLEMVAKRTAELEQLGTVAFQTRALPGGGNPARTALLNEQQSSLIMMFLKNTPQVIAFKLALVKAFFEMNRRLNLTSPTGSQEVLFTDDTHGIRIGKPVAELPELKRRKKFDPREARNNKIAQVAREAKGAWVPLFIDRMTPAQLIELKNAIKYGARTAFTRGEYRAEIRNDTLYIRHAEKELTV